MEKKITTNLLLSQEEEKAFRQRMADSTFSAYQLVQLEDEHKKIEKEMEDMLVKIKACYTARLKIIKQEEDKLKHEATTSDIKSYLAQQPREAFVLVYDPEEFSYEDDDFVSDCAHLVCPHYGFTNNRDRHCWEAEDFKWDKISGYDLVIKANDEYSDSTEPWSPCPDQTCSATKPENIYHRKSQVGGFVFAHNGQIFNGDNRQLLTILSHHIDHYTDHQSCIYKYDDFDEVDFGDWDDAINVMIKVNVPFTKISLNFERKDK